MRLRGLIFAGLVLLPVGRAWAQTAETPRPDDRIVRAEAPVVAGNAVSAKKRAIADALRQATERSFTELIKEGETLPQPWPAAVSQLKASLASQAQRFITSYRLVEQQTENGVLRVMVEANVDEVLLRKELDRARGATVGAQPATAQALANYLLVGGTAPVSSTLVANLSSTGMRVHLDSASNEAQLLAGAAKQNAYALFVAAKSASAGAVRGNGQIAVQCDLGWRLFAPSAQVVRAPTSERIETDYGFGKDDATARSACLDHVVIAAGKSIAATLRVPVLTASFVTLRLDISEPGSVSTLLQSLKRLGAVTSSEVRHVAANTAEIRVFTRLGGSALTQALTREVAGKLDISPGPVANDVVALRVRAPGAFPSDESR